MSERTPEEALLNFAKWMKPPEGDEIVSKVYGLTAADAYAVLAQLAAEKGLREAAEARAAGLREALRQCIIEISYLVDQTDSFVGGSTCRALDAGKSALLAAPEQEGGGDVR